MSIKDPYPLGFSVDNGGNAHDLRNDPLSNKPDIDDILEQLMRDYVATDPTTLKLRLDKEKTRAKQALYQRLASEAVQIIVELETGKTAQALPISKLKEVFGVVEK